MWDILKISITSLAIIAIPLFSNAQIPNSTALEVSPEFPQAQEQYTVKLNAYNLNQSSIQWLINGTESREDKNSNMITLQAGDTGTPTSIVAKITQMDGSVMETAHTVTPNRVDLIIEANTVVPAFYHGRRLPSSGSEVFATALVFAKNGLSSAAYSYVWKVNGTVQNGGPIQGKNTFSFTPSFEYEALLSVDVLNANGQTIARETQVIPIVKPELYFYEKNPLRGLSFIALPDPHLFIGEETTIRAEGYFMAQNLLGNNVLREWEINGRAVPKESDYEEISVQKQGNSGSSVLSFHIRNLAQLLQGVERSITLEF